MSQAPAAGGGPRFFVSLESLRGIAALVVIFYHAEWYNPITPLRFVQNGPLMVDLFFVLSGFVIYHSYGSRLGSARGRSLSVVAHRPPVPAAFDVPARLSRHRSLQARHAPRGLHDQQWLFVPDKPVAPAINGAAQSSDLQLPELEH